ncbi:helix-turn-helix transcriptional regulator [Egicoccus halophilus]|uniref:Protein PafB n=1 Tax=Egicoccus halophilus TaxID=1670830 RepID=A0A8J3AC23_9ACTN|nr:WYL domain-containing protein [Egicoccus halophilus]GGI04685.1 protein PafB [Egicoccus halophilus]
MAAKVERLVNLTVALLEARQPMTLAEIRRRTRYYTQGDPESSRRMFERDKDDLRRLGVPVETREVAFGDDLGYVIDRGAYELADVDLTAEEVAALSLAVQLTGTEGAHLALAKLAARAPDPAELATSPTTRVSLAPDPVDAVADAVVSRTPLSFPYRTAGGETARRTVDPYAVVQRRGAWYLVGRDHDRDAVRAFRLDRFVGRARDAGPPAAYVVPDGFDPAAHVSGPEVARVDVEVAVRPAARWTVELHGGVDTGRTRDGQPVLRLRGLDPVRDRSWLLGLGDDVEVLAPPELRDAVMTALRELAGQEA